MRILSLFQDQNDSTMKRMALLILINSLFSFLHTAKSQDLPFRNEVNFIDSVLRENPTSENFFGITYYYSLDITPEREIVVKMDFMGPFTTIFKARLTDLNPVFIVDTAKSAGSICWSCKPDESGMGKRCVRQINIYTTGEKDTVNTDEICLVLPAQGKPRRQLIDVIDELVKKILAE
jgi:hypothetical protein